MDIATDCHNGALINDSPGEEKRRRERPTCNRGIYLEDVGLDPQKRRRFLDDPYCMVLTYPTFSVKVVFEESHVRFGRVMF